LEKNSLFSSLFKITQRNIHFIHFEKVWKCPLFEKLSGQSAEILIFGSKTLFPREILLQKKISTKNPKKFYFENDALERYFHAFS